MSDPRRPIHSGEWEALVSKLKAEKKALEDILREDRAILRRIADESELIEMNGQTMVAVSYGAWRSAAHQAKRDL